MICPLSPFLSRSCLFPPPSFFCVSCSFSIARRLRGVVARRVRRFPPHCPNIGRMHGNGYASGRFASVCFLPLLRACLPRVLLLLLFFARFALLIVERLITRLRPLFASEKQRLIAFIFSVRAALFQHLVSACHASPSPFPLFFFVCFLPLHQAKLASRWPCATSSRIFARLLVRCGSADVSSVSGASCVGARPFHVHSPPILSRLFLSECFHCLGWARCLFSSLPAPLFRLLSLLRTYQFVVFTRIVLLQLFSILFSSSAFSHLASPTVCCPSLAFPLPYPQSIFCTPVPRIAHDTSLPRFPRAPLRKWPNLRALVPVRLEPHAPTFGSSCGALSFRAGAWIVAPVGPRRPFLRLFVTQLLDMPDGCFLLEEFSCPRFPFPASLSAALCPAPSVFRCAFPLQPRRSTDRPRLSAVLAAVTLGQRAPANRSLQVHMFTCSQLFLFMFTTLSLLRSPFFFLFF